MIAGCHDEIDVVVEEDVADLVVESAPHGVVGEVWFLAGDEVARADDDVNLAAYDVVDGGADGGGVADGAVACVDVGDDGDAYGIGGWWEFGRGWVAIVDGRRGGLFGGGLVGLFGGGLVGLVGDGRRTRIAAVGVVGRWGTRRE